jgi:hypothetical protein
MRQESDGKRSGHVDRRRNHLYVLRCSYIEGGKNGSFEIILALQFDVFIFFAAVRKFRKYARNGCVQKVMCILHSLGSFLCEPLIEPLKS